MPLNDITSRANNSPNVRQQTLLASMQNSRQRFPKRRSVENRGDEQNVSPTAKRTCTKPKPLVLVPKDKSLSCTVKPSAFSPHSMQRALRQRSFTRIVPRDISAIHVMSAFVSSAERAYQVSGAAGRQLPMACRYSPSGNRLALVDEEGHISIFDTTVPGAIEPLIRWQAHEHASFDVAWNHSGTALVTASADETCRLWDVETGSKKGEFCGHSKTVRAVDWRHMDDSCFASGSRDGGVLLWDIRSNKTRTEDIYSYRPVSNIALAHSRGHEPTTRRMDRRKSIAASSVTGLRHLHHNPHMLATSGAATAAVKLWDVRNTKQAPFESVTPQDGGRGIASLALDPDGTRIYAPCNDSRIHVHNSLRIGESIAQLQAPEFVCRGFSSGAAASSCGRYLAAGSATGAVVVWELDRFGTNSSNRRAVLEGHMRDAGCVAWNPQRTQLASCADDGLMRLWDLDADEVERGKADVASRCRWGFAKIV
ncbi:hypothetical protein LPJ73_001647 [Coemansia sp. RSA 2703]|nr:hypothetical protein LPJ73_001647 [Coemansia sp. RSA 2703]KAJ2377490.1 hypothetical protein IW150_001356 [Coemansia sp. RSA 2607]KAJ2397668.1 hypothetical protein GGI05_000529 [Coemansia sp. RSA 2603]